MKQKRRSKILTVLNTLLLLVLLLVPVYAFVWNRLEDKQLDVGVGKLDEIEVMGEWLNGGENKQLIPVGAIATKTNEVTELEYELTFVNSGNTEPTVIIKVTLPNNSKLAAAFTNNVKLSIGTTKVVITFTLDVDKENWDNDLTGDKIITITFELED